MGDVIEFPKKEEIDIELEITKDIMKNIISQMCSYQYDIVPDGKLFKDVGLIFNMFYAMLLRNSNEEHAWHDMMDELIKAMDDNYSDLEEDIDS